jgi:hypothetical protein
MNIDLLDRSRYPDWDFFIAAASQGSIYHSSQWLSLLEKTYGYKQVILTAKNDHGEIIGGVAGSIVDSALLGKRFSSMPCAQQCPPLFENLETTAPFLESIERYLKIWDVKYFEVRMTRPVFPEETQKIKNPNLDFCTYVLDLQQPFEELKKNFHNDCIRRAVSRATKSGLKIIEGKTDRDIEVFYQLYAGMRKENGLLPQPIAFFRNLWDIFRRSNSIELMHAVYEGTVYSSLLLLKSKKTVVYEYGATKPGKKKFHPSPFLIWHAIEKACTEGFLSFDFGRCSIDDVGLNNFKARWGAVRKQLYYYSIPEQSRKSSHVVKNLKIVMNFIVKYTPQPLLNKCSNLIYKQFI